MSLLPGQGEAVVEHIELMRRLEEVRYGVLDASLAQIGK
jgi:hypothetical protein